jgi:hypothetical protein
MSSYTNQDICLRIRTKTYISVYEPRHMSPYTNQDICLRIRTKTCLRIRTKTYVSVYEPRHWVHRTQPLNTWHTILDAGDVKKLDPPRKQGWGGCAFNTDRRNGSFIYTDCVAWSSFGMISTQGIRSNQTKTYFTTTTSTTNRTRKKPRPKTDFLLSISKF